MMQFKKAIKAESKLRLALIGPSGSGKTYSALAIATGLGGKIAVLDTERGSAAKYADLFEFDSLELSEHNPQNYIEAIQAAEQAGYEVLIIDSLTHAWSGKGGALELVDKAKGTKDNSFAAWRTVTPLHNQLIDAMLGSRLHLIATMRSKMEHVQEKNEQTGKTEIRKVGMQAIQREGMEYEFDVVGDLDQTNTLTISKTRCPILHEAVIAKPGKPLADTLKAWLTGVNPYLGRAKEALEALGRDFPTTEVQESIEALLNGIGVANLEELHNGQAEKAFEGLRALYKAEWDALTKEITTLEEAVYEAPQAVTNARKKHVGHNKDGTRSWRPAEDMKALKDYLSHLLDKAAEKQVASTETR